MSSIYDLSSAYLSALDLFTDPDNEIDLDTINDTLESIEGQIEDKILNLAKILAQIDSNINGREFAIYSMKNRQNSEIRKRDKIKQYIIDALKLIDKPVSDEYINISLAKSPDYVNIIDERIIPVSFFRDEVVRKVSKTLIKDAGGCPGAEIVTNNVRLVIK